MTRDPVTVRAEDTVRHAARLIAERRHNRLPVVDDDGQLPASSPGSTCSRRSPAERRRCPCARWRRVDLAAVERNAARLRERCRRARAVRGGQGRRLRPRRVPAARAALAGGAQWLAVATAAEAAELRAAGIDGADPGDGRAQRRGARGRARRPAPTSWPGPRRSSTAVRPAARAGRDRRACTSSSTPAWAGSARAARTRRSRSPRRSSTPAPGCELAGAMTHFATADEDPEFMAAQLARFAPFAATSCAGAPRRSSSTPPTAPRRCASPAAHFDLVRCGIALYGLDPFSEDPAATASSPRSSCARTWPRSSAPQPGRERRLRPALHRRARRPGSGRLPIGYGDGVRRGAQQRRRGADRRPPLPARRHREHGQHHRRPRPRAGAGAGRRPGDADRRRRRARQIPSRSSRRRLGHDQLRDRLRDLGPRAPRATTRRRAERERPAGGARRARRRRRLAGRRRAARRAARPARRATSTSPCRRSPRELAARRWRGSAGGYAFELSEGFGGWRVVARDRSWQLDLLPLGGGTIEADLAARDLTINALARAARRRRARSTRTAGSADLRRGRLRMVSPDAFAADPLRVLRLARLPASSASTSSRRPRRPRGRRRRAAARWRPSGCSPSSSC